MSIAFTPEQWEARGRHLEVQRAMDGPRIAGLEAENARFAETNLHLGELLDAKADEIVHLGGVIGMLEGSLAAQAEVSNARFDENTRLRAHLAAAGTALDELTKLSS